MASTGTRVDLNRHSFDTQLMSTSRLLWDNHIYYLLFSLSPRHWGVKCLVTTSLHSTRAIQYCSLACLNGPQTLPHRGLLEGPYLFCRFDIARHPLRDALLVSFLLPRFLQSWILGVLLLLLQTSTTIKSILRPLMITPQGPINPSHSLKDIIQQALSIDIYTIDMNDE